MEAPSSFRNEPIKDKLIFLSAIILIGFIAVFVGNKNAKITLNEDSIKIAGANGGKIKYNDIIQIDTITYLPPVEMRTNGTSTWNMNKGNFILKDIGHARLFMKTSVTPIVVIRLKNKELYYINCKNRQSTIDLFEKAKQKSNISNTL